MKKGLMHSLIRVDEADISDKIMRDPGRIKQLQIAWKHDKSLPPATVSKMGTKPDDKALAKEWSDMLEKTLARTNYGDLSRDMKFADWLTKLYTSGAADWEDISGEGGDALGAWDALSKRGLLKPIHQDLNRFISLQKLYIAVMRNSEYQAELQRIKNAAEVAKMKKDARDIVLVDDDRYWAAIPFNYGACYVFNNAEGVQANFCTGGSSGMTWFKNYAPDGPIVMVVNKANVGTPDGKWQFHAPTNQLVNASQDRRYDRDWNDERFAGLFPGLMRRIGVAMIGKKDEIEALSKELLGQAYNVPDSVSKIKGKFPKSWASKAKDDDQTGEEPDIAAYVPENWKGIESRFHRYLSPDLSSRIDPNNLNPRMIELTILGAPDRTVRAGTVNDAISSALQQGPIADGSIRIISKMRD